MATKSNKDPKKKEYYAVVESIDKEQDKGYSGHATVDLDGSMRKAYIPASAKHVRAGDTVKMIKDGVWIITSVITRHEPPAVNPTMGTKPPAASTTSGSTQSASTSVLPWNDTHPTAPRSNIGSTLASLQTWATNTRTHLINQEGWGYDVDYQLQKLTQAVNELRSVVNNNATRLSSTQQTVNTNASRLNQTVDYASGATDAMGGIVGALKDEGIVK